MSVGVARAIADDGTCSSCHAPSDLVVYVSKRRAGSNEVIASSRIVLRFCAPCARGLMDHLEAFDP